MGTVSGYSENLGANITMFVFPSGPFSSHALTRCQIAPGLPVVTQRMGVSRSNFRGRIPKRISYFGSQ